MHGIGSVHHELEIEWRLREFQGLHACIRNTDSLASVWVVHGAVDVVFTTNTPFAATFAYLQRGP